MKKSRPIVPAPKQRVRYPRVGVVWSAFAAGTLGGLTGLGNAHADCALPQHEGAVDPGAAAARPTKKKHGVTIAAPQVDGQLAVVVPAEPVQKPRVAEIRVTGGVHVQVSPPQPVHVKPQPVPHEPLPQMPGAPMEVKPAGKEPAAPHASNERTLHIHPHGPDEPCRSIGTGNLVLRFT